MLLINEIKGTVVNQICHVTRSLDGRVREHIGYIRNLHTNQPTGEHLNFPGHELFTLPSKS